MALFTDGPPSNIEDLTAQDTQLASVANVEGIDVTQKLFLAQEQLSLDLEVLLTTPQRESTFWLKARPTVQNVVVTPALRLWHTFRSLEMVYEDAYSDQLNDRYARKRDQFHMRANRAYENLLLAGIGIVWTPMPRAKDPQVTAAAGGLANGTYYAAMTWCNQTGEEGSPSAAIPITTSGNTFAVQPATGPQSATSWNVYAGTDPDALSRQNESPIAVAQTWVQPRTVVTSGTAPGRGQSPNYLMPLPRMILRG